MTAPGQTVLYHWAYVFDIKHPILLMSPVCNMYDCGLMVFIRSKLPLSSSIGKLRAPRRFSKLSRFSCLSSLTEGRCPAEPVPALDLDMERAPRPLFDGDDRNAVEARDSLNALSFQKIKCHDNQHKETQNNAL